MFSALRAIPMLPPTYMIKTAAEEGHELPKLIQGVDSLGSGMMTGIFYSPLPFAKGVLTASKIQFPNETPSRAVMHYVRRVGRPQMRVAFVETCAHSLSHGALVGAGLFVATEVYKGLKKQSEDSSL